MIGLVHGRFFVREEIMGFLDNLLRREVRKAVSGAVDMVADGIINAVTGQDGQDGGNTVSAADPAASGDKFGSIAYGNGALKENKGATRQANCSGERLLRHRIEEIAAREKPEYELRQKVSSSQVGAPGGAEPYFDYGFYRDGMLAAVIQILDDNNAYCRKSVRLAQQACEDRQVAYMNFMSYMTNRPEYIAKRLEEKLR